ncbi:MAG: sigma-70 family RNA polymerase sigma factor [Ginsengibacter sp.]
MDKQSKPGYYIFHPEKGNELFLLRAAKASDKLHARAAKNQLIIDNEGFLRATIQEWVGLKSFIDFDYLLEEARISFFTAIEKYDLNQDVSIRTYAKFHLMELRRQTFRPTKFTEFKKEYCGETFFLPNPDFKNFDLKAIVMTALEKALTILEQEVIYMHFFEGYKKRQIALQRQCSEARVCTIVKNALPKLKVYLLSIGIVPGFLELN